MKRVILGAVALSVCLAARPAAAAPGDPFGGTETGCVPSGKPGLACGKLLNSAFGKLIPSVLKCHLTQATQAFKTGHSSTGFDTQEENCSVAGPKSAKVKFDAVLAKAAAVCPPGILPIAESRRDTFLADASNPGSLDSLNFVFFCDDSSGLTIAEPGGGDQDENGFIPASSASFKCSVGVLKALSKLVASVYKCHTKAASTIFANKPFDTDAACEESAKGAHAKFEAAVNKYINAGICPACISDVMNPTHALAIGTQVIAALDAQNEEIYPCPAP